MKSIPGYVWVAGLIALVAAILGAWLWPRSSKVLEEVGELALTGSSKELREGRDEEAFAEGHRLKTLLIAIDGMDRKLLYDMLHEGELPNLSKLVGVQPDGSFPSTHFSGSFLSVFPSITMAAWTTIFTGVPPSTHGIVGNEFFVRERLEFVAPAPVTVDAPELPVKVFTDGYLNQQVKVKTVFERMRERWPDIKIWTAMQHLHRGADKLILTSRGSLVDSLSAFAVELAKDVVGEDERMRALYSKLDIENLEEVAEELEKYAPPDFLSIYLPGNDLYAHSSELGPDRARRKYMIEKLDPGLAQLVNVLGTLEGAEQLKVMVVSDHGHTEVLHDNLHALSTDSEGDPPEVLRAIGRRLRPFDSDVKAEADFDTVLAYQGAMALVYLADRSLCEAPGTPCDWSRPPRAKDVLDVADAFFTNNAHGRLSPQQKKSLDMILVRNPKAHAEVDEAFRVYTGNRKSVPLKKFLEENPRPGYLKFEERLSALAVGPLGERAGDVMLVTSGNRQGDPLDSRFYFASMYRSWHGSASAQDSELPFVVYDPGKTTKQIASQVGKASRGEPWLRGIADVMMAVVLEDAPAETR